MDIEDRVGVGASCLDAIRALVSSQHTLGDVVQWGLALSPPRLIADLVIQDEYTYDVTIAYDTHLYLIYDTT